MRYLLSLAMAVLGAAGTAPTVLASPESGALSLHASVGFDNRYRVGPQWVPVSVHAFNRGGTTLDGEIAVRGNSQAASTYTEDIVLYPGTAKDMTIDVPATAVGNSLSVQFRSGPHVEQEILLYPEPIPDGDLLIGALTDAPESTAWLSGAAPPGTHLHVAALSTATLPSQPEVLAELDAIVVSNADTSQLDATQIGGLRRYVSEGGSLLDVGGLNWQATLGGLPPDLVPGTAAGSRSLRRLPPAPLLGVHSFPRGRVGVTSLSSPRGVVLMSARGLPLLVKQPVGDGLLEYLGFDPSQAPLNGWKGTSVLAKTLVAGAVPLSLRRLTLDEADRSTSFLFPGSQPMGIGAELANVPSPALPLLLEIVALLLGALLIVGLVAFLTRGLKSRLTLVAVPLTAVLCGAGFIRAAPAVAASRTLVNTLGFVRLDGGGPTYPATVYAGLIAPVAGIYHLDYRFPALASNVSTLYPGPYWDGGTMVREGGDVGLDLGKVGRWSVRALSMRTVVRLQGRVAVNLRLTSRGKIVGTVRNDTDLVLHEPALIAGRAFVRIPDIPAHASAPVQLTPSARPDEHDYLPMLTRIYGRPQTVGNGIPAVAPFGSSSDMPPEGTIADRIRNAVDTLPETNLLSLLGQITFVAWSDHTLAPLTVNGAPPQHRDLTLLAEPVRGLDLPSGHFRIQSGTVGAQALEVRPAPARYQCCGPTAQPISLGPGGSATFAFHLPGNRVHLSTLQFTVYAGGADPAATGYEGMSRGGASAYNWKAGRWESLAFRGGVAVASSAPSLVSHNGYILLRLEANHEDLSVLDPHADLQIEATGDAT